MSLHPFPSHQLMCFSFLLAASISPMFSQALPLGSPGLPTTNLRAWAAEQSEAVEMHPGYAFGCVFQPQPQLWWLEQRASFSYSGGLSVSATCPSGLWRRNLPLRSVTDLLYWTPGKDLRLDALVSQSLQITTVIVSLLHMEHCTFYNSPFSCGFLFNPITTCQVGDTTTGKLGLQPGAAHRKPRAFARPLRWLFL